MSNNVVVEFKDPFLLSQLSQILLLVIIHGHNLIIYFYCIKKNRFDKRVTQCFVPTRFCYNLAKKEGLRDDQITLHGSLIYISI